MDVVFTIVSRNYAAQAASLMESLAHADPEVRRVVVATDGPIPSLEPLAQVLDAAGIVPEFGAMSAYYDALELNTAVKPHAFRALLGQDRVRTVTYLDPDIIVYRPLDLVRDALDRAPLVLTPHLTRPLPDAANPNDHTILLSGSHNLGFMAVRRTEDVCALIDWWAEKCRFDCRVDFAAGLFTDQRWMDLAPGLVGDHVLLRDPGLNLAYWNLPGRRLERAGESWSVDGQPLIFFHFSGFDPASPGVLSKHQDRIGFEPGSPLAELLADYARRLIGHGHQAASATPYAHARFPNGRAVTGPMRRRLLRAARGGEDVPARLDAAASAWLDAPEPAAARLGLPDVTRLMDQIWREDAFAAARFERETLESRLGVHAWFVAQGLRRGADAAAVAAARRVLQTWRDGARRAAPWQEIPWEGPAGAVAAWLRAPSSRGRARALAAMTAARADLRARFADDADGLLAWCLGPEALAGRFAVELLPEPELDRLRRTPGLLLQAARFAAPATIADSALKTQLFAAFTLAAAGRWPPALQAAVADELGAAGAAGLPQAFLAIWRSRPDLQRLFPLASRQARFRFLRWLAAGGLAEYGVEPASLPPAVRRDPTFIAARASVRSRLEPPVRPKPRGQTRALIVSGEPVEGAARQVIRFDPAQAQFWDGDGQPAHAPAEARLVVFVGAPGLAPADAVALVAQGVSWKRAAGVWAAADAEALKPDDAALGFVDEIWTETTGAPELPRPVRVSADPLSGALASAR